MENFSELIKNRRSMRKFTDEELTQDEVVTLMKAALMSPSSKRSNSWQFVVIDDKEMLKELSHCKEQASSFIADAALAHWNGLPVPPGCRRPDGIITILSGNMAHRCRLC